MISHWIGAILIIGSCGSFGLSIAAQYKKEELMLYQLDLALGYMECELQYQLTELPDLVRHSAKQIRTPIRKVLLYFAEELEKQLLPDAASCMKAALHNMTDFSPRLKHILFLLGQSLGRFDLSGQLKGLHTVRSACSQEIKVLSKNREQRIKSYRILGFCAGTALAVILL